MKKALLPAAWLLTLLAAALLAFLAGRVSAPSQPLGQTFYASVDQISGSSLAVTGLEVNDINHRGEFTFSVEEDTVLEWRHAPLTLAELEPVDTISVTYTGAVLESYPAQLTQVVRVQLLEDEK